jgi:hypothetical protein
VSELGCPTCGSRFVRRSARQGLLERLLSVAYIYPFRCQLCNHRFRRRRPGERWQGQTVERREYDRLPVEFWSTLWWNERPGGGRVVDLSLDGCTLQTETPVQPGEVLQMRLEPGGGEPGIVVDVAVVRSVQTGRVGLQFVGVAGQEQARLRGVVRALLEGGTGPATR